MVGGGPLSSVTADPFITSEQFSTVPELRITGGKTTPLGTLALPPQNCTEQLSFVMLVYCTESQAASLHIEGRIVYNNILAS